MGTWTKADLKDKAIEANGRARLVVVYGQAATKDTLARDYYVQGAVDDLWLRRLAIGEVDALNGRDTSIDKLQLGAIDLTAIPDPEKSDKEKARIKFFADYIKLRQLQELVTLGLTGQVVTDRDAVLAALNDGEYLSEYF